MSKQSETGVVDGGYGTELSATAGVESNCGACDAGPPLAQHRFVRLHEVEGTGWRERKLDWEESYR